MKQSDDKLKDVFNNFKNGLQLNENMEGRLLGMIEKKERSIHQRKFLLGVVSVAIAAFLVISSVAPVFGKSGTLPQVIAGLSLERSANSFSGSLSTEGRIIEELEDQDLSPADSIIIVALLKESGVSVNEIIEMRNEKMGWGKILSELGISVNSIKNTLEQAQNVAGEGDSNGEGEENMEENQNQLKFVVIKGILSAIDDNTIIVNETEILLTEETSIKCKGKSVSANELSIGNELLVKALKIEDVFEAGTILVLTNMKENNASEKETKEFELRSVIVSFDGSILTISDFDNEILVDENTKIQKNGVGRTDSSVLVVGDTVQIHIRKSNDKYYATSIVILKATGNEEENEEEQQQEKKEFELRSVIASFDGSILTISDFEGGILVDENTNIQRKGEGRVDIESLEADVAVQIHIRKDGDVYHATSIVILEKTENEEESENEEENASKNKKETFKGEVSVVNPDDGTLSIVDCDLLFKISEDTLIISNGKAELSDINVGDSVEIIGTEQEEGEPVSVEKITVLKEKGKNTDNSNENSNSQGKESPGKP